MATENHLTDEYKKILSRLMDPQKTDTNELIETVFETKWIRLLLLKSMNDRVERISIEVELSLPKSTSIEVVDENSSILNEMITHLKYLKNLQSIGFEIEVMRSDCLWTATMVLDTVPNKDLCKALLPP
ncbi:MAG: hypothetical protein ACTSUO_07100 [Candidatus Thorarchaeota archaeon]